MKKEYHEDTDSTWANYGAGRAYDDFGRPMPFWRCHVVYTWSEYKQAYWVYSVQVVGFGMADDRVTHETEVTSLSEAAHLLDYYRDMEACYKSVYGE